jgi:hypothetical protein
MTRSELRHEMRVLLRLLESIMREDGCHRRMRHAIRRAIERSYDERTS